MSREPPSLMAECPLTPSLTQKPSPTQNLDPNLLTQISCSHRAPQPSLVASWSRILPLGVIKGPVQMSLGLAGGKWWVRGGGVLWGSS